MENVEVDPTRFRNEEVEMFAACLPHVCRMFAALWDSNWYVLPEDQGTMLIMEIVLWA